MLIPGADTPFGPRPWTQYTKKLARAAVFADQTEEIERLAELPARSERVKHDRPWVAIMVSEPGSLLPGEYETLEVLSNLVRNLGCQPILVPPMLDLLLTKDKAGRQRAIDSMARRFHGLIGPGGADVHPRIYRSRITHAIDPVYPRDRFEADFVTAAMRGPAFLLGICRSHQLWNAATGGKLVQDVREEGLSKYSQDQDQFDIPRSQPFVVRDADGAILFENRVTLDDESQIAGLLGEESILTNSLHHQAVAAPGEGFAVTGLVPDPDTGRSTIEATETWNVITTQFHPELMLGDDRFRRLVETVARRAHVFFQADRLAKQGRVGIEGLLEAVSASTRGLLLDIDAAWVRSRLAPALGLA